MKIAIGTDDNKTIRKRHFGESQYYLIYELLNGKIHSEEIRDNPNICTGKHVHAQASKITDLLHDCQLFMGSSMGAKSLKYIAAKNIEIIVTSIENVEQALNYYLNSKDEYFKYYNAEKGKFCECINR